MTRIILSIEDYIEQEQRKLDEIGKLNPTSENLDNWIYDFNKIFPQSTTRFFYFGSPIINSDENNNSKLIDGYDDSLFPLLINERNGCLSFEGYNDDKRLILRPFGGFNKNRYQAETEVLTMLSELYKGATEISTEFQVYEECNLPLSFTEIEKLILKNSFLKGTERRLVAEYDPSIQFQRKH